MGSAAPERWFDISMPLSSGMPAFPEDPVFSSEPDRRIAAGDAYNLSRLALGSHTGTHLDPPRHFFERGAAADALDLHVLNGGCEVVDAGAAEGPLGPGDLAAIPPGTTRVLVRTANSSRWAQRLSFFPDYVALGLEGARFLHERGVRLVGIDSLSIESDPSGTFPVHRELLGHGTIILEGLLLDRVPPGAYELVCLPLLLREGDGAPARAILRPRGTGSALGTTPSPRSR